ncbi:MFS transporter [Methylosarcina fibrata]|uniref:MFS transporter n=1 Tax=Methylosarcina fibrata TaxID=105972 RepID=UPI000369D98A|nr:MFS transporter [Methylosarcina fibrata]
MTRKQRRPAIPGTVWVLGFVSLFMDVSSELIHSLLPVFLVGSLGAGGLTVGLVEGFAEAAAQMIKIVSGSLSDFLRYRKRLILLGYGLSALTKPLFPLASSIETVFTARFLDRIGKGLRGAPRDALMADVAPPEIRGACFGLRQSMDTAGAFLGPLLAVLLLYLHHDNIKAVLWFAVVPAAAAVLLILAGVQETEAPGGRHAFRSPVKMVYLNSFSHAYWHIVAIGGVFTLSRFSEAFLVLRAQQAGLTLTWLPMVMVVMNVVYALSAYPAGALSDRWSRHALLSAGLLLLACADLLLAVAASPCLVLIGVAFWGLHMGFTQGILAALVADAAPSDLKGSAFGVFNFVTGLGMLAASLLAGWLWDHAGAAMTFYAGAGFSGLAVILLRFGRD